MGSINMEMEEKYKKNCGSQPRTASHQHCQAQFKLYKANNVHLGVAISDFPFFPLYFYDFRWVSACKSCFNTIYLYFVRVLGYMVATLQVAYMVFSSSCMYFY